MYWVTLPAWFWIGYYLLILIIFSSSIFNIIRKTMFLSTFIALLFTITVPMISLMNSIERSVDQNEFEHLLNQLKQGSLWSIYTFIGYLYLLACLVCFFPIKL
jgi:hypothetical protein